MGTMVPGVDPIGGACLEAALRVMSDEEFAAGVAVAFRDRAAARAAAKAAAAVEALPAETAGRAAVVAADRAARRAAVRIPEFDSSWANLVLGAG